MNSPETTTWRPLLEGRQAEDAWQVIVEIASAVGPGRRPPVELEMTPDTANLPRGAAGLALFFSYLAEARPGEGYAATADDYLDQALEALEAIPMGPELYGGFTGIGWTAMHLAGRAAEAEDGAEASYLELDEFVLELLQQSPWPGFYDLVSGLVGFGVYALAGVERATARECLELLVLRLEELARPSESGILWHTPPEYLPPWQQKAAPRGYYNLGVAHGVPGMIAVLGEICGAGLAEGRARPLLDGAVAGLFSQELAGDFGYPAWNPLGGEPTRTRLAWCYGDPGVAATLLLAARRSGHQDWEREALRIAKRAADRPPGSAGIRDAGLCHGSAGLGHLFNRMYQASGDEQLAEAARYWFRRTLEMRQPKTGVGGFLAYIPDSQGRDDWQPVEGFLTGASGIALALLAAICPFEPRWDRVLLTSIPSHPLGGAVTPDAPARSATG